MGSQFFSIFCQNSDNEVLRAMRDELERNMNELQFKDYEKPFFISYLIFSNESERFEASGGALTYHKSKKYMNPYTRVFVGDYNINNNNYFDKASYVNHNDGFIPLPDNVDYWGIRRHFWLATNNSYKVAAEKYKNKMTAIKAKNLKPEDFEAPDFSKEKTVTRIIEDTVVRASNQKLIELVQDVSAVFSDYPEITDSWVKIESGKLKFYHVNSEGTEIILPENTILIYVNANAYTREFDNISHNFSFSVKDINDLPSKDELVKKAHLLADNLVKTSKLPAWTDSYEGPVMLEKQPVFDLLFRNMFNYGKGLVSRRIPLINDPVKGIHNSNEKTWESKLGHKVCSKIISMYDFPFMSEFQNQKLYGMYEIDADGITPSDTLELVKNGMLQNLYTLRIPTKSFPNSNGHWRNAFGFGSYYLWLQKASPGNVLIKSSEAKNRGELKKHFLDMAKDDGLAYAVVFRPIIEDASLSTYNCFKVDVNSGDETQIRSVGISKLNLRSLKDIVATSDKYYVHNLNLNLSESRKRGHFDNKTKGCPCSFIYPDAVILKDTELEGVTKPMKKNAPIVASPLYNDNSNKTAD